MWTWLGAVLTAGACEAPLTFRTMLPPPDATEVPVTVEPLLALIGMGDPDTYTFTLNSPTGTVATQRQTWCYDHEGPHEQHCWVRLVPDAPLAPETTHRLVMQTDDHAGSPLTIQHAFETGAATSPEDPSAPHLAVLDAWMPPSDELTACDWDPLHRWSLAVTPVDFDPSGLTVYQLYHRVGGEDALVHTLFQHSAELLDVKQYLDGATPTEHCFVVVQEDGAGGRSAEHTACWGDPEPGDSGTPGGSGDSAAPADSAAPSGDSAPPQVGPEPHDSSDSSDSSASAARLPDLWVPDAACQGGCAASFVPLLWLGALLRRREP